MFYFFEPNILMQTNNSVLAFIASNNLKVFMFEIWVLVSGYVGIKSRYEKKQLLYLKKTKTCSYIIDKNSERNFTYTRILLWNSSQGRIRRQDILETLQVNVRKTYRILNSRVTYSNMHDRQFTIPPKKEPCLYKTIEFSYLMPGEGAVIEIRHTGKWSKDIKLSGEIIKSGNIQNAIEGIDSWRIELLIFIIYAIVASILLFTFLWQFNLHAPNLDEFWKTIIALIVFLSSFFIYIFFSFENSPFTKFLKRNIMSIPKDLYNAFNNNKF